MRHDTIFRRLALVVLLPLLAGAGPAGAWHGQYVCGQGLTALDLTIKEPSPGRLTALFHFAADPANPGVPEGCFSMAGRYDAASGAVRLDPGHWVMQPAGYVMVGLAGRLGREGRQIAGRVTRVPVCTVFSVARAVAFAFGVAAACQPAAALIAAAG